MKNINRITLIGQLTADPESKQVTGGHALTTFRLATNYSWKDDNGEWMSGADYHTVVSWDKLAQSVAALYKKGERVFVEGKLRTSSWTAEDGTPRSSTKVVAKSILPMSSVAAKKKSSELSEDDPEAVWERQEALTEVTVTLVAA